MKHIRLFLALLIPTFILFFIFKYFLVYRIGWHDGLNLDWYNIYYPVAHANDPYTIDGFLNPPWMAWILRPFSLLSPVDAHILWIVLTIILVIRCVYAIGGNWLSVLLTIASPGFFVAITHGQVDALVLLGLLIGSWLLVLIKPQVAGMIIAYEAIRERRIDWTAVLALPLAYPLLALSSVGTLPWSITPWPYGIPAGLLLFTLSLLRRDRYMAAVGTFFFAPYLSASSVLVYSAILTSRYGRLFALLFSAVLWLIGYHWFV